VNATIKIQEDQISFILRTLYMFGPAFGDLGINAAYGAPWWCQNFYVDDNRRPSDVKLMNTAINIEMRKVN